LISQQAKFAEAVANKLKDSIERGKKAERKGRPSVEVLTSFFNTLFFASIKTEEGRSIQVRVFYMDPADPDPDNPQVIRSDRWTAFPLKQRIPFNVANLVKLAKAADPWSSGVAVFHDDLGELFVWGLVDQVSAISMAIVQEGPPTYPPPGYFHALVNGPADITVFKQLSFIARMAQDSIIENQNDCLWHGAVSDLIDEWLGPVWNDVSRSVSKAALVGFRPQWRFEAKNLWTTTLSRILINIQRQRHGGAVLFCPAENRADLSIKYELRYSKVPEAIRQCLFSRINAGHSRSKIEWEN
jgi:hypothetical protein